MPRIIIQTEGTHQHSPAATLSERLVPADGRSDYYLDQLLERIGWALLDAEELEAAHASETVSGATHRRHRVVNPRRATARPGARVKGRSAAGRSSAAPPPVRSRS
jgi:hypothetical protein